MQSHLTAFHRFSCLWLPLQDFPVKSAWLSACLCWASNNSPKGLRALRLCQQSCALQRYHNILLVGIVALNTKAKNRTTPECIRGGWLGSFCVFKITFNQSRPDMLSRGTWCRRLSAQKKTLQLLVSGKSRFHQYNGHKL
jgi:hypothetical protein